MIGFSHRRSVGAVLMLLAASWLLLLALAGCSGDKKDSPHRRIEAIARSAPTMATVLLNNDDFVVMEFTLEPGDVLPAFWGGKRVNYALTDFKLKKIEEDKDPEMIEVAANEMGWYDNEFFSLENVGETTAHWISFARRDATMEKVATKEGVKRMLGSDPEHADILLENEYAYGIHYVFPAGAFVPAHRRTNRVFYVLEPSTVEYESETHGAMRRNYERGGVYWQKADTYSIENVGEQDGEFIIVSFRK